MRKTEVVGDGVSAPSKACFSQGWGLSDPDSSDKFDSHAERKPAQFSVRSGVHLTSVIFDLFFAIDSLVEFFFFFVRS